MAAPHLLTIALSHLQGVTVRRYGVTAVPEQVGGR